MRNVSKMSLYLSEAPRQDTVADWTLLSLDQLGRILISLVGVGRQSAMNNIASVLLPFYGLCILVFLKQLIVVCDGHLGFFFLIEILDDVSVFHDNQAISIFQSIFHMVGDHKSCEGILFHKLIG